MGIRIFTLYHNREGLASERNIEMFMPMFYIELEYLVSSLGISGSIS